MITLSTICGTGEARSVSNVESLLKDFNIGHNRVVGVAKLPEGPNILLIGEPSLQQVIHELRWYSDVDALTILLATPDPHEVIALGSVRVVVVGTPLDTAEIISAAVSVSLPGEYVSRHQVARKLSHHILENPPHGTREGSTPPDLFGQTRRPDRADAFSKYSHGPYSCEEPS